jgi:hypothetical protein
MDHIRVKISFYENHITAESIFTGLLLLLCGLEIGHLAAVVLSNDTRLMTHYSVTLSKSPQTSSESEKFCHLNEDKQSSRQQCVARQHLGQQAYRN